MKRYRYDFELYFYFQPIKLEKYFLTKDSTLQKVFNSMLLHCFARSEHVLSTEELDIFEVKKKQLQKPREKYTLQEIKHQFFQG